VRTRHGERQDESRPGCEVRKLRREPCERFGARGRTRAYLDAACTPKEGDPLLRARHEMKGCCAKGYHCVDTHVQYGAQYERCVLEALQSRASSGTECCADEHHCKSRPSSTWSSRTRDPRVTGWRGATAERRYALCPIYCCPPDLYWSTR
jgi:hypothetical protein